MRFEQQNLFWIMEADRSVITDDKIIIYTEPNMDYGRGHITDFAMTMRPSCR